MTQAGTPAPVGSFPLRVAAIDMGSNAIRFAAHEFTSPSDSRPLDAIRAPVRLGAGAFRDGSLAPEAVDRAVAALFGFRRRMEELEIDRYRAVATSAVRESRNGAELLQRARKQCGIALETISGQEEARLAWVAIRKVLPIGAGDWLLLDLGGGSVEVSLVGPGGIRWTRSFPVGAVRLLQDVGGQDAVDPEELRRRVAAHPEVSRASAAVRELRLTGLVALGGNMDALADLAGREADHAGVRLVPRNQLSRTLGILAGLSALQRVRELDLAEDRADVILPAAALYERLALAAGADELVAPGVGVKEGILLDVASGSSGAVLGPRSPG